MEVIIFWKYDLGIARIDLKVTSTYFRPLMLQKKSVCSDSAPLKVHIWAGRVYGHSLHFSTATNST